MGNIYLEEPNGVRHELHQYLGINDDARFQDIMGVDFKTFLDDKLAKDVINDLDKTIGVEGSTLDVITTWMLDRSKQYPDGTWYVNW